METIITWEFSIEVVIDDGDSAQDGRLISTLDRIQVTARIAKVDGAVSGPQNWFAKSNVIEFTESKRIKLEIVKH